MVRKFCRSVRNGKRGLPLEVVYNFRTDFPENYCSITEISGSKHNYSGMNPHTMSPRQKIKCSGFIKYDQDGGLLIRLCVLFVDLRTRK